MPLRQRAIIVFGDVNVDILGSVERWPQPGDDCLSPQLQLHLGGVAANCALALTRWGLPARLVGCVGSDEFGNFLRRILRENGVDTQWLQSSPDAVTGLGYISIMPDGQRTFFGSRGANRLVRKPARPHALFHRSAAAHFMGYNFLDPITESTARHLLKNLRDRGIPLSLDVGAEPSRRIPRNILHLASQVDILFVNVAEALALTSEHDPQNAFRSLLNAGAREVVLKLGKEGSLLFFDGAFQHVPAFPVRCVDSTGAGDAFVAAFLQARLREWPPREAALVANAAGAAAATILGAGENLPHLREIVRVLQTPLDDQGWEAIRHEVLAKVQAIREPNGRKK